MSNFKPLLAVNSRPEDVKKPSYGSIKYEGVRGVVRPDGLVARSLKPFANTEIYNVPMIVTLEAFCKENNVTLEGEFYLHGVPFRELQTWTGEDLNPSVHRLEFMVFDAYRDDTPDATFETRYNWYQYACSQMQLFHPGIKPVHQQLLVDPVTELTSVYAWAIENGYEGVCVKARDAKYKHGRSTLLQGIFTRMKPEKDYDCVVLQIIERQHNLLESEVNELGQLKKRQDKDMKAGAGIAQTALVYTPSLDMVHKVSLTRNIKDHEETKHSESREWLWENRDKVVGRCMRFVGIPVPGNDVPRSPRFDAWRGDLAPWYLAHDESGVVHVTFDQSESEDWCKDDPCAEILPDFASFIDRWYRGSELGKQS